MSYNRTKFENTLKKRNLVAKDSQNLYHGGKHGKSSKAKRKQLKTELKTMPIEELEYIDAYDLDY